MKNKVEGKPCAVRGTQGNGAQRQSFLWLDYGTGGRKSSPHLSREVSTHQKWLVKRGSEKLLGVRVRPPCPHDPWETEKGPKVAVHPGGKGGGGGGGGMGAATVTAFQAYRQIKSAWRNVCCTNIRSLTENSVCSTPIFSIQVPRSLQLCLKEVSRQGLLSAGCQ